MGNQIFATAAMKIWTHQNLHSDIRKSTGYEGGEVWKLDLAEFSSISAFVDRFEKEGGGRLDFLVENAGLAKLSHTRTEDDWETT